MINNRQAGRRRGRGGGGGNGNGGQRPGGQGRPDNGNRIDSRARGNANQLYEKYKNLASDAQRQGDRVNTEYYLQFADHYFRVLSDQRGRFEEQQPRRQQPDFDIDGDDEFGDEGEPIRVGEQGEAPRMERQERADRQERFERSDRPERADRQGRSDRSDREERSDRQDRGERPDRQRDARRQDGERPERPRRWEREERAPRPIEVETEVAEQRRADPVAAVEQPEARAIAVTEADAPVQTDAAPRRRGRPRRDVATAPVADVPTMNGSDGGNGGGNGVDADRLPPALGIAAANDADDDAPKPRRRRTRAATVVTGDTSAG